MKSKSLVCLALLSSVVAAVAQTSTFTYQGQLTTSGNPAVGVFDLRFTLHDAATAGSQVGSALTNSPVNVSNGVFTVTLDFGNVFDGSSRWLAIGVRTNGAAVDFTTLAPRQLISATPYAIRAANYSGQLAATNLTGKISDTNLSANVALTTNNVVFTRGVTASNFIGSALGLTNLAATNLVGTIPDARLSANVALLNLGTNAFLGSVSATNFYGYGGGLTNVPGRLFDFVPTGSNLTAQGNYGYLATNNVTPVIITLPLTANIAVGSTIRVSGGGAAGWIIAQNSNQVIQVANLSENVGFVWRTKETSRAWKAAASSSEGSKLVSVVNSGQIYTSTNYGVSWTARDINRAWSSVASSADGAKLVACVNGTSIFTSTDSGASWSPRFGPAAWISVASSLDGSLLVAASGVGVYASVDSGASWIPRLGVANWTAVASSANGSNLVATLQGGRIQTSTDAGANWTARESNRAWTCVASSADGGTLVAGVSSGSLYVSPDFGVTWIPNGISANWAGVSCSADGSRMLGVANGGGVYVSTDSGMTWQQRANLPAGLTIYTGAAVSGDGSTMVAVANSNPIYISSQATTTVGTAGQLSGAQLSSVELQYIGNGVFMPISYVGTIRAK